MGHCCVSRNPGRFVPGPVFLLVKGELVGYFLDCRLRGRDTPCMSFPRTRESSCFFPGFLLAQE
jgi:hypothetical protein